MKPEEVKELKIQELNEALNFAREVDKKIKEYDLASEKVAAKWQKKVEFQKNKVNK